MHSRSSLFMLRSIANRFSRFLSWYRSTRFALRYIPTLIFRLSRDVCLLMPHGTWSSFRVNYLIEKKIQEIQMKQSASFVHALRELWEKCASWIAMRCFSAETSGTDIRRFSRHSVLNMFSCFTWKISLLLTFSEFSKHHFLSSTLNCLRTHFFALLKEE